MNKLLLKHSNNDGFTLIEMLVVIVMVGILAAIAAPSWLTFLNSRRVNTINDEILQALRQAQVQSIRTKRSQTVIFNTAANPPTITVLGTTTVLGNGTLKPGMAGIAIINGTTSLNCLTTSCIEFNANGNIVNDINAQGIRVVVTAPPTTGSKRCVVVETLLGAMRSAKGTDCN